MTDIDLKAGQTKVCNRCLTEKCLEEFSKHKAGKYGRRSICKSCDAVTKKNYYDENRDRILVKNAEYHAANPEKARARSDKYHKAHPERVREAARRSYAKNKEEIREKLRARYTEKADAERARKREYYKNNREKCLERGRKFRAENPEYDAKWRLENPEKVRSSRKAAGAKMRESAKNRIGNSIREGIRRGLKEINKKSGKKTFEILGYTQIELCAHLEKLFLPGMTWENYGSDGWEIDHKIPHSAFNYETPNDIDFKKCWALENLQPLWRTDNRRKNNKLSQSFQPSLALAIPDNDNKKQHKEQA